MKRLLLTVGLVCGSLLLQACGGSGPVATRLSVTSTSGTATAGTAFMITVSVLDGSGAVFTKFTGTIQLTSSDSQAVLPPNSMLTNGTGTFSVTLNTAGTQTVTATSGTLTGTSNSITVSAGAATLLSITAVNSTAAGTSFNITVKALDASNNAATSYSGTVHFTSSDSQALLPANSALTNGTGTFSVTLKTVGSSGTQTITATDTVILSINGTSNPISVSPGPPTTISVQAAAAETTGIAFSATVSALDTFGNIAPSYTGTVHFTSTDTQAILPANSALTGGTASFQVTLKTLGMQTMTASDTVTASLKGTSGPINVVTNAATHIGVTGPSATQTRKTIQLTVTALDAANNRSVGYTGTVHFTSTDSQAKLPADSTLTAGTANFSATLETVGSGTQTITATDAVTSSINGSLPISVTAPAALGITSVTPPGGTVGVRYDRHVIQVCNIFRQCFPSTVYGFPLTGSGGISPYKWSWAAAAGSSLPAGLNVANPLNTNCPPTGSPFAPKPGCIYGTPTEPGTFSVVVTLTDSGLPAVQTSANYTMTIALPPPPIVNATPVPPRGENLPYSFTFTASGFPPLTWSESGALPTGLMLNSNGTLSGTPTQTGSFPITVTATDQFNQSSAGVPFTIVITAHGFVATGSMATARRFHTATLLGNGKVLVAGGEDAAATAFSSAELYDPTTGTFSPTKGSMTAPRVGHTATLLGNGKVLITGGATDATEAATATAELYDPATDTFTATGNMTAARVEHTATLLQSGKVLVVGGDVIFFNGVANTNIQSLASAEIFDPSTGTFTATGSLSVARESHTATLLNDGRVLVAGGSDGTLGNPTPAATVYATAELFNPAKGTFTAAGMMTSGRDFFTASLLGSGKVLATGGINNAGAFLQTADLYDPTSTSFAATGNMTATRFYHDGSVLNDGTVLLTGGSDGNNRALASAEVYDPTAGTFAITGSMLSVRVWHTSTLLPNGKVLVTGGADNNDAPQATAELYQ